MGDEEGGGSVDGSLGLPDAVSLPSLYPGDLMMVLLTVAALVLVTIDCVANSDAEEGIRVVPAALAFLVLVLTLLVQLFPQ